MIYTCPSTGMNQSSADKPCYYTTGSDGNIWTGPMGGCTCAIVLGRKREGRYSVICGQHGAGGIKAINFAGLMDELQAPNVRETLIYLMWSVGNNQSYKSEVCGKLREMHKEKLLGKVQFCVFYQFECNGSARVNEDGSFYNVMEPSTPQKPQHTFSLWLD